jgi:hypothetical protein
MKDQLELELIELKEALAEMKVRIEGFEQLEAAYKSSLDSLAQKEAFNFALFQYNPVLTVVVDREGRVVKSNKAKINSGDRLPNIGDVMYKDYASHHEVNMYQHLMDCMNNGKSESFHELWYGNKVLDVTISPFPNGAIITSQDITAQKVAENDRLKLIEKLQQALGEVETLRGLLPICACCKKIRDDNGYWNHIEAYLSRHSSAEFTHTLCPDCVKEFYPKLWKIMEDKKSLDTGNPNTQCNCKY